jgi:hypothetical protein
MKEKPPRVKYVCFTNGEIQEQYQIVADLQWSYWLQKHIDDLKTEVPTGDELLEKVAKELDVEKEPVGEKEGEVDKTLEPEDGKEVGEKTVYEPAEEPEKDKDPAC